MNANPGTLHFDADRAARFEGLLRGRLNDGALCLMISIGHRTGLFDAMAEPAAVDGRRRLPGAAGLNDAMSASGSAPWSTGRVRRARPATAAIACPPSMRPLTRAARRRQLAVFAQYIALLGGVEDDIVECFRQGGGVPYEAIRRFHEVMAEDSGQTVLPRCESHILPLVPGLVERLEPGHPRARRRLWPRPDLIGWPSCSRAAVHRLDLSRGGDRCGRAEAERLGLRNLGFVVRDLSAFDDDAEPGASTSSRPSTPCTIRPAR